MNQNHLEVLTQNYIENFQMINNDDHAEYYKWEAVQQFQKEWDPDAPDFAAMFKRAVSKTENLINNHITQPANGIIKLAEHKDLTEQVRDQFRILFYTNDAGNLSARQDRIEKFVDVINGMLEKAEPGKWRYRQEFRSGLFYLNLFNPSDNYIFKATQARAFKQCVEFDEDFGSGAGFRLPVYYKLCDLLVNYIKQNDTLKELHQSRLTDSMYRDDDYHIIVFDMIYCAVVYELYRGIDIFVPTKANVKKRAEEERLTSLQNDLMQLDERLSALTQERAGYDGFSVCGLDLQHKMYGTGKVIQQDNQYIIVRFADCEKKFMIPQTFESKQLSFPDLEVMDLILAIGALDQEIESVKRDIFALKTSLKRLYQM